MSAPGNAPADALVCALREFGRPTPEPLVEPEVASLMTEAQLQRVLDLLPPKGTA